MVAINSIHRELRSTINPNSYIVFLHPKTATPTTFLEGDQSWGIRLPDPQEIISEPRWLIVFSEAVDFIPSDLIHNIPAANE